jgi:hypothetical protein
MPPTTPPLVSFYSPNLRAPDPNNRTLAQILAWPDSDLEHHHDYIQTLFPLPEPSPFNPYAPTIDKPTFDHFRSDPSLRAQLRKALVRMLTFYGFQFSPDGTMKIVPGVNFHHAAKNWVMRFNHNHLRITRIIRSLRVLGLEGEAEALFEAVKGVGERSGRIGGRSLEFWGRAAERPLFIAPEDEEDEGRGGGFLYEFEAGRGGGGGGGGVDGAGAGGEEVEGPSVKSNGKG